MYQLMVAVQKYLCINQIKWNLDDIKSNEFEHLSTVVDDVIKEHTAMRVGTLHHKGDIIV